MAQKIETGLIQVPESVKKNADKIGYMTKQGGVWKTWKKRYFVLKDNMLYYFAYASDSIPKGVIDLDGAQVEDAEAQTGRKFCFLVKTKKSWTGSEAWDDRGYFLQTDTGEEMNSWMDSFRSAASKRRLSLSPSSNKRPNSSEVKKEESPTVSPSSPQTPSPQFTFKVQSSDDVGSGSFEIKPDNSICFIITLESSKLEHLKTLTQIHFVSLIGILNAVQRPQIRIDIADINHTVGVIGPFTEDEQQKLKEAQIQSNDIGLIFRDTTGTNTIDLTSKSTKGLVIDFSGQLSRAINYPHDNPSKEPLLKEIIQQAESKNHSVPTGAYYELGRLHMSRNNFDLALECLDKEIKSLTSGNYVNPHASFPLNTKAVMHKRAGKIDLAKETFEKALLLRPNYFEALITYSTILASSPHTMTTAFELVARAIMLQPDSAIFGQLLPQYVKIFSQENDSSLRKRLVEQGKKIDLSKPSVNVGPTSK